MQRQLCYSLRFLDILCLTYSDMEPLIWPNTIKMSREIQTQPPGVFSSCLTAVNTSSLQLVSCWWYFGHLFPKLPHSPNNPEKHFSCYITLLPLHRTEASVQRLALILHFSDLGLLLDSSMYDHTNLLPENSTHATESLPLPTVTNIDAPKQIDSSHSAELSARFSFLQV